MFQILYSFSSWLACHIKYILSASKCFVELYYDHWALVHRTHRNWKYLLLENTTALFIQFSLRILETNAVQNDSWTHIVMSETKSLLLLLFVAISCYVPIKASVAVRREGRPCLWLMDWIVRLHIKTLYPVHNSISRRPTFNYVGIQPALWEYVWT
jgi:hypothetical protein